MTPYSSDIATAIVMDAPHKATAYFKIATTVSFSVSSSSLNYGESMMLSGSLVPERAGVSVELSYSLDGGVSWLMFMVVKTSGSGAFGTVWTPPYPLMYLVRASWNGDHDYLGATSAKYTVTVTGAMPSQPSLQLELEDRMFINGQTITLTVTVFNPADTTLEGELCVGVVGPGGYYRFDAISISVEGKSKMSYDLHWHLPSNALAGTYQISTWLVPPWLGAYDVKHVQVE